jgi:hypothetical protein
MERIKKLTLKPQSSEIKQSVKTVCFRLLSFKRSAEVAPTHSRKKQGAALDRPSSPKTIILSAYCLK